jgi:uncharacterized membrane protein YgcG
MSTYFSTRTVLKTLFVALVSLLLMLGMSLGVFGSGYAAHTAYANSVMIKDQANVLDVNKVDQDASHLSDAVAIYTTRTFSGDQDALNTDAKGHITSNDMIVIEIDTVQRHLSIQSGTESKINDGQASDAVEAFKDSFNNGDYTGATIASLDSLQSALTGGSTSSKSNMTTFGIIVAIILAIAVIVTFVLILLGIRKRRGGPPGGGGGRGWGNRGYGPGYYPYPGYVNTNNSSGAGTSGGGAGGSFGGGFGGGSFGGGGGGAGGSF